MISESIPVVVTAVQGSVLSLMSEEARRIWNLSHETWISMHSCAVRDHKRDGGNPVWPSRRLIVAGWAGRGKSLTRYLPAQSRNQVVEFYQKAWDAARKIPGRQRPGPKPRHSTPGIYLHNQSFKLERQAVWFTKHLGWMKLKRPLRYYGHRPLNGTIKRDGKGWVLVITWDFVRQRFNKNLAGSIGLDPGAKVALTGSSGPSSALVSDPFGGRTSFRFPDVSRLEKLIAKARKALSRKQRPRCSQCQRTGVLVGKARVAECQSCKTKTVVRPRTSSRMARSRAILASRCRRLFLQKRNHAETITRRIAEANGSVAFGDVRSAQVSGAGRTEAGNRRRTRKRGLNKSIREARWHMLKTALEYKAKEHGAVFTAVQEAQTTQTCSVCGQTSEESRGRKVVLGESSWTCGACGSRLHRDGNAAENIRRRIASGPVV